MRRVTLVLLLALAAPVAAHHTKEHVLGAPSPPPMAATVTSKTSDAGGRGLWLALGPFFALAALGALRWGYRHHREGKNKNPRG